MNSENETRKSQGGIIDLMNEIMACQFSEQQRRILDLIIRLSIGCGKEAVCIPIQKDFETVGVRQSHIKHHLDWLIRMKVITRDYRFYKINPDFEKWRVSKSMFFDPERLEDLVELNERPQDELLEHLEHLLDLLDIPRSLRHYVDTMDD